MKSISLSTKTRTIGTLAFVGCEALTSIQLPSGLTTIDERAFTASGLTTVDIPDSVTFIGDGAFSDCKDMSSIHLPKALTSLGSYSLAGCPELVEVVFPTGVTRLNPAVLASCGGLRKVTLPPKLESVGNFAFERCGSLLKLDFPKTLTYLSARVFDGSCLERVNFEGPAPIIDGDAFLNQPPAMVVYYYDRCPGFAWPAWKGVLSQPRGPEVLLEAKQLRQPHRKRYQWFLGSSEIGRKLSQIMRVRNVGTEKLRNLSARIVDDPTGSFSCGGFSHRVIDSHSMTDLKVVFQPGKSAKGRFSAHANLQIRSNDGNESPIIIGLTGSVIR